MNLDITVEQLQTLNKWGDSKTLLHLFISENYLSEYNPNKTIQENKMNKFISL